MVRNQNRRRGLPPKRLIHLKRIRIKEGINRSDLARKAEVADKTVQRVEAGKESQAVTLYKILNGLNTLRNKDKRGSDYSFREVFPNHQEE
jgi:DNA-binding XRE family transcriptional regulator